MNLNTTERILRAIEGKNIDYVPTMCLLYDSHPAHQILGEPRIKDANLLESRVNHSCQKSGQYRTLYKCI